MLAASRLAANPGPHQYAMTHFSESLADPTQHSAIRYWYDVNIPLYTSFPAYLSHEGYQIPKGGPASCMFNWAKNYKGTLFEWFSQHPEQEKDFGYCMKGYAGNFTPWTDIFPTEELVSGGDSKDVVVVDVGGSFGHDINVFQAKHSLGPGRLVLQDQEKVIALAQVNEGIQAMTHDFMTPQVIKGRSMM